ncbi:MAG: hypothetical protein FJ317_08220 [SAR202 cluster bacterium]|nr:hypothetical protein [SAR202 cluster bacterium]
MSWIWFALSATFLIGFGSIIEKLLISRYLPGAKTFLGWLGLTMIPHAAVMVFLFPVPDGVPASRALMMLAAGACWGMSGNLMYRALQNNEASRVWPVLNVAPVYVAIMAVFFLGEHLSGWQWAAILVAVSGTVLISIQPDTAGGAFKIERKGLAMLLTASILNAVGSVIAKYGLEEVPPLTGFWIMRFGMLLSMSINFTPAVLRNMAASVRSVKAMGLIGLAELILFPAAVLMMVFATDLGPVSLVSTVNATVPVWVFLLSTLFSTGRLNLLNERIDKKSLALKGVAISLMLLGVIGVTLL